jgi:hypothetical protein
MGFRSNFPEVRRALLELGAAFDLRRRAPGRKGRLGEELIDLVAAHIEDRTRTHQLGPDGRPLRPLAPSTLARKRSRGFPPTIGVETGEMLDVGEIRGKTHVDNETVVMQYGLGEPATSKAEWFQEGDSSRRRPAREFYDLGEDGEAKVMEFVDEVAEQARKDFEGN